MAGVNRRALHWVFKIGNRPENIHFFKNILGMKVLRHEEFEEGCEATCNGPYDNKWSKTMIGYAHEDTSFVCELTYNYGIGSYTFTDDFKGFHIESTIAYDNIKKGYVKSAEGESETLIVSSPDGYPFFVKKGDNQVPKISIAVKDLLKSIDYWRNVLGMSVYAQESASAVLGYLRDQTKLELIQVGQDIKHDTAIGRIAFSCPWDDQPVIREKVVKASGRILTDLTELPTPGKATVRVIILLDPDGYEICFVGDEGYRDLSQFDPKGDELLLKAMEDDKSTEWFSKKGKTKAEV